VLGQLNKLNLFKWYIYFYYIFWCSYTYGIIIHPF
jgi:hypothetical protein